MKFEGKIGRRALMVSGGAALLTAAMPRTIPAQAATIPAIPQTTVRLGAMPFTNHAWCVLIGRKGFAADVGITFEPREPRILLEQHTMPQLHNGEIDVTTAYAGLITGALDKLPNIKPIHVYSFWAGNAILAAPDSGIKTIDDFIAEGLPWDEASHATMMQLKGKQIAVPPNPSTYPWMNLAYSFAGLNMNDSDVVRIEDPKAVQLGLAGRVPLAAPGGAVQIYQLQFQAGWKVVMSTNQMIKHVPTGTATAVNNVLNYDLFISTQKFIDENRDTVLRLSGAIYRTLDYMFGPTQNEALATYAPFINAHAGSDLDVDAIKYIFDVVDPFYGWDDQAAIWTDPTFNMNYKNIYKYQLAEYIKNGTIADRDYDLDDFFQAKNIWEEMKELRAKTERLMAKANGQSLSDARQKIADMAKTHYDGYNYLDASRFMEAALA
jgi:ABC-type nitrate/sulfonate/bicarbonate transport system substrate-binding protein